MCLFAHAPTVVGAVVVGAIHTNTIEGFWSLLKRGPIATAEQPGQ
jgi:hypothetical protein